MKRPNLTTIGMSILVINLAILSFLFFSHFGKAHNYSHSRYQNKLPRHHNMVHGKKYASMDGHSRSEMMEDLGLNDSQKSHLDSLTDVRKEMNAEIMNKLSILKKKEQELIREGKLNDHEVAKLAADYGSYQQQLHTLKLNHMIRTNALLTESQKIKFNKLLSEKLSQREHRSGIFQ